LIRLARCSLAFFAFGLISALLAACHSFHVDATIENRTGAPVELLEVDYPSASFGANRLDAGADFHYRFQIRGSGPIAVSYTAPNSRAVHISGPTLTEGQQGQLQIILRPDATADFVPHFNATR
jgi:hypothetical protein